MKKPLKPCNHPMCPNLTRTTYCDDHASQQVSRHAEYDKYSRDKKSNAFYQSKAWKVVRQQALLRDYGLCVHCSQNRRTTMADMVDHIVPLKEARHLGHYLHHHL